MKRVAFVIAAVFLATCGRDEPSDPTSTDLGTQTQAQTSRPARCVFHQKPWISNELDRYSGSPAWDLRDPPTGFCRQHRESLDDFHDMTFDATGRPLEATGRYLLYSRFTYDTAGRPVRHEWSTGHAGGDHALEFDADGTVRSAVFNDWGPHTERYSKLSAEEDCRTLEYQFVVEELPDGELGVGHRIERYDNEGWPVSIETTNFDGRVTVETLSPPLPPMRRDAAGHVIYENFGIVGYEQFSEFNARGQLVRRRRVEANVNTETTQTFRYDRRGRLWKAESVIRQNYKQLLETQVTVYVDYLRTGQVRERVDLDNDGTINAEYLLDFDAQGRLVSKRMTRRGVGISSSEVERWDFGYCP